MLALILCTLALNIRESDHCAVLYGPCFTGPFWEPDTATGSFFFSVLWQSVTQNWQYFLVSICCFWHTRVLPTAPPPPPAHTGILPSLSVLNAASAYFPPHLHPVIWSCCSGSQQTAQMFYSWMNEEGDLSYWGSPKICWSLSLQWMWLNLEVSSL